MHCITHYQHPDNRYRVFLDRTTLLKGCTTFAYVSVSNSSPVIVLLRNGNIPDFILGINPAVDIVDAVLITYCKGKAISLQAFTGPEGSRRWKLADFKTIGT
jgi:hypothetical protein